MTDDKSTLPNILKWASEVSKGYLKMSLSEKLEELKKLKSVRSGLEEELKNAELKIMVLDGFHDVKDYKVKKDEVAVALLSEIKEKG
ncbi:MAG TPA: hypothetical protein ENG87_00420 [Candidatus Pacearchaeota archaeon]|nr:hypothetical protein [Candidatus Pacearchaeota archaeon]